MVLLTGENTTLATYLLPLLRNEFQVCSFDSGKGDLCDPSFLNSLFNEIMPDVCINCEEIGDYADAEANRERAYAVNGFAPGLLGEECKRFGITLIHISTTAIYDHATPEPATEDSPILPVSVYTDSKNLGEEKIRKSGCSHCILRMTDLYGKNDRLISVPYGMARRNNRITLIRDSMIMPLYAADAARFVHEAYTKKLEGVFNVTGPERMTNYEFLFRFFDLYAAQRENGLEPDVVEVDYDRNIYPADLPLHNCADSTRFSSVSDVTHTPMDDALRTIITELSDE